ncbi:unnamed protein product [Prunus armeniaca]
MVPAMFVVGDSMADNDNNNIPSCAKANYLPYGIDFRRQFLLATKGHYNCAPPLTQDRFTTICKRANETKKETMREGQAKRMGRGVGGEERKKKGREEERTKSIIVTTPKGVAASGNTL